MRPENLRFGAPLKGGSPDEVKHPPKVHVGRARSHTPFRWLRPPTSHALHALRRQIDDFVENNVAHEKKTGGRLRTNAKERIALRLDHLFGMMHLAAGEVESLGDWLIRIQHDLFHRMLGHEADRILFLPMADLTDLVGYEVALFRLGLGGWVVGSHAPYHPVIEQVYSRLFRCEMPPKFFLTSMPKFRGMGDPAQGYGRTRLLRALLEMEPSALAAALSSPWSDDPKIHSDLLRFPDVPSIRHTESIYQKT